MKNEVYYEWSAEQISRDGDIIDCTFAPSLISLALFKHYQLCLLRRKGNDIDGEIDRLYAYVKDNRLPDYFEDSDIIVPGRFKKELEHFLIKSII